MRRSIDALELDEIDRRHGDDEDKDGQKGRHGSRLQISLLALAAPRRGHKGVAREGRRL
jgi:hypothetical protein